MVDVNWCLQKLFLHVYTKISVSNEATNMQFSQDVEYR